jgi:hypothetical protein
MVKKLLSLIAVTLFTLSLAGSVLAAEIKGNVAGIEREGRYITIKSNDGKMTVTVRISSSSTELNGVGDRAEIVMGQKITATYDKDDDRKTASAVTVK